MRRIARTHCSTLTVTTRSSGIGSSPMRPATRVRRCRTGQRGGSHHRTAGGVYSGRSGARTARSPDPPFWLTDITEHNTAEGKLYLCAVKDAFSGWIVGYSIDSRMKASLAVRAVRNAVRRRGDVDGCIVHSDRGSVSKQETAPRTCCP